MKTETWLAFGFGAVFLLLSLVFALVAFYLPKPANPEIVGNFLYVMQVILAISASGVAAVIPGFLSVNVQQKLGAGGTFGVRAGGAIAVFVLIFVFDPKSRAIEQMSQRVAYNEALEKCRSYIASMGPAAAGAIQYCMEARDYDPKRWEAYWQLARAYLSYGNYDQSVSNYEKAIELMLDRKYSEVKEPAHVKQELRTQFAVMSNGIATGLIGMANSGSDRTAKIALFERSLSAIEKARWFMKPPSKDPDPLLNLVQYNYALDLAYIWLTKDQSEAGKELFDKAVGGFRDFLTLPGAVPQWAQYHLACLFSEAATRFSDASAEHYQTQALTFARAAVDSLSHTQNERTPIQARSMKCLLLSNPPSCQRPHGSEPMICTRLAVLVQTDSDLIKAVTNL
jgi:hypothetical protein